MNQSRAKPTNSYYRNQTTNNGFIRPRSFLPPRYTTPWISPLEEEVDGRKFDKPMDLLTSELESFIEYIQHTDEEVELRKLVTKVIGTVTQRIFKGSKLAMFGSSTTGLFLPDGDIDLVVLLPSENDTKVENCIRQLRNALIRADFTTYSTSQAILQAKVPILKFKTTSALGSYSVDISFNLMNGIQGADLQITKLKLLGLVDENRVRDLVLIVKQFLSLRNWMEVKDGGIGGLTLFCMVYYFIKHYAEPYNSRGQDLCEFFDFYGHEFEHHKYTIVIDFGLVEKGAMRWEKGPADFRRLSIQHPIETGRDIASGSYGIESIIHCFQEASRKLNPYFNFSPLTPTSYSALKSLATDNSILKTLGIHAVPQMVANREANHALYQSGKLQRMLPGNQLFSSTSIDSSTGVRYGASQAQERNDRLRAESNSNSNTPSRQPVASPSYSSNPSSSIRSGSHSLDFNSSFAASLPTTSPTPAPLPQIYHSDPIEYIFEPSSPPPQRVHEYYSYSATIESTSPTSTNSTPSLSFSNLPTPPSSLVSFGEEEVKPLALTENLLPPTSTTTLVSPLPSPVIIDSTRFSTLPPSTRPVPVVSKLLSRSFSKPKSSQSNTSPTALPPPSLPISSSSPFDQPSNIVLNHSFLSSSTATSSLSQTPLELNFGVFDQTNTINCSPTRTHDGSPGRSVRGSTRNGPRRSGARTKVVYHPPVVDFE